MIEEFHPCYSLSFCATHCTNTVELSAMLVLHEKIIGQFHLVYHIHHGEENFRQNSRNESRSARSLPVPTSPNLGLPPAMRKLCEKRTGRPRKSDRLIDWQRRNFAFCARGTLLADQLGIRCGQMIDGKKLNIVRNMNKAIFENW
jgi:hypothetical protein